MSQTVTILRWCDNDQVHEAYTEAATVQRTVLSEDGKPHMLDLCATCDESVQAVFRLAQFGTPVELVRAATPGRGKHPPADAERPERCAWCDHTSVDRQNMSKHTNRVHRKGIHDRDAELARQSGGEPALPALSIVSDQPLPRRKVGSWPKIRKDAPRPYVCLHPRCGKRSTTSSAVYQHAKKYHDLTKTQYIEMYGRPVKESTAHVAAQ